jgi:hypothetical protein
MNKCKICGKEFENGNILGGHVAGAHQTKLQREKLGKAVTKARVEIKSLCKKCGKEFNYFLTKNKDGKINHKAREKTYCSRICANSHKRKNWECKICNSFFQKRTDLFEHKKVHGHMCKICGKIFISGQKLAGHLISHRFLEKLKENTRPPGKLRERLLNLGLKEDKCEICGWAEKFKNDKYSRCQLHHKDGDAHNNFIDNLQILCPNCHSLTESWGNRYRHKSARIYRHKVFDNATLV